MITIQIELDDEVVNTGRKGQEWECDEESHREAAEWLIRTYWDTFSEKCCEIDNRRGNFGDD